MRNFIKELINKNQCHCEERSDEASSSQPSLRAKRSNLIKRSHLPRLPRRIFVLLSMTNKDKSTRNDAKAAFTLVETIMTLFIIGVVITASIMTFTSKHVSTSVDNTKGAWQPCDSAKYAGLCTTQPVVLNPGTVADIDKDKNFSKFNGANIEDALYSLVLGLNASNYLREYFATENKGLKINNHVIRTERATIDGTTYNNFYISSAKTGDDWIFPSGNISNTYHSNVVIGNTNGFNLLNDTNNVIIGSSNTITGGNDNNTILGNTNNIGNTDNNFIFGNNNSTNSKSSNNNVIIGNNNIVNPPVPANADNYLWIGTGLTSSSLNKRIKISNWLYADLDSNTLTFADDVTINGQVHGVATVPSDIRLKNIKSYYNKGLREILELEPVTFYYKNDKSATEHVGIIAQDLQKVFPEAVTKMPNGYLGVDTTPVFFASVNALKEINRQTVAEEKRAKDLEDELISLEKEINDYRTSLQPLRHCEERSDEAISENKVDSCNEIATDSKCSCPRNDVFSFWCKIKAWFVSLFNFIRHCEERSDEAISENKVDSCNEIASPPKMSSVVRNDDQIGGLL